jgi:uncharacterized protein YbjT (DUF2867 family)
MTFVITGANGHTGKIIATTLLEQGKKVRVVVRSAEKGAAWKAKGAEVVAADIGDAQALKNAFEGAEAAYLLIPPNMAVAEYAEYQRRTGEALVAAVAQSRIPHVVLLSSIGAQLPSGTGPIAALGVVERALAKLPVAATFLRPAYFMENFASGFAALDHGIYPTFFAADHKFEAVATRDIALMAVDLLLHPRSKSGAPAIVELAGPEQISVNDLASLLSKQVGKPIAPQVSPVEAMVPALTGFGFQRELATMYQEMTTAMQKGVLKFEQPTPTRGTTTLAKYLPTLLGR